MKIIATVIYIVLVCSVVIKTTYSQSTEFIGDTIEVELSGYKEGNIQWQFSSDKQSWSDIKGAISAKLIHRATESGYFRAKISGCTDEYLSDITSVDVDTKFNINPIEEKYKYKNRLWQGIPSIERTPNGRLWATYYSGDKGEGMNYYDNWVVLVYSDDNGKTWTNPILVIDPPNNTRAFDSNIWYGPDGKLWLFWAESNGFYDGIAGVWTSYTEMIGTTNSKWSNPRRICDGIMLNKPIVIQDSIILYPVAQWEIYGGENNPNRGSNVFYSYDNGNSVKLLSMTRIPQSWFNENMIVKRNDGFLWMLTRTGYGIGEVTSSDDGKTWTNHKPTNLQSLSSRFHIRKLKSGNLLLLRHNSPINDGKRSHLSASLSLDHGKTWSYNLLIDERVGVSYPDATSEDEQGNIYIIYDFDRNGKKNILICRLTEKSIINANFLNNDGKPTIIIEGK